ncbi:amino acid/amide ABC transporter substrate-binding protein (HAAT family) [Paracoccus versutus]|uniref:Amino acid/amide ABC transporter substrate-binding protein (HAAT family) n=1 Tax=Paracoccus versutus TaxID=34007 RepID=A0AAQ0KLH3_PARVE|nr:ABC transporter substrate-binding protein [Paracoccus versutus]REG46449.1 amino acid/amide ABC transporter substrate-binding protein (HAAT family) [Paracoccus versutus]
MTYGRFALAAGFLSLLMLAPPCVSLAEELKPIIICSADDQSNGAAEVGQLALNGLRLAVDEKNAAGGIAGRNVEIVVYDIKMDFQLAGTAATRCAEDDGAIAITGAHPDTSISMIPVANEYEIPLLLMALATDNLTDNPAGYVFRVGPRNGQDAQAIADMLAAQGFKRVALIGNTLNFGLDGIEASSKALAEQGIDIVQKEAYEINAVDLSPQILSLKAAEPDAVIVYPYSADGARVLRTMRQLDLNVPTVVARSALLKALREMAAEASDGILIPNTVDMERPEVQDFFVRLDTKFGVEHQPTMYPLLGYDTAQIIFAAAAAPAVQERLAADDIAGARVALKDAIEEMSSFYGLQGREGAHYEFGKENHHGSPDDNWFTFVEVKDAGTTLSTPDLSKFKPGAKN